MLLPPVKLSIIVYENRNPDAILERWIRELLTSISALDFRGIEVVFVVEDSHVLLSWLQRQRVALSVKMTVVFSKGSVGLNAGRNLGIARSSGDYIAFVDDDEVLESTWADAIISYFDDSSIIAMAGSAVPLSEVGDLSWFPSAFEWLLSCTGWTGYRDGQDVRTAWGNNMAFRSSAFSGGRRFLTSMGLKPGDRGTWNETGAEDVEFCLRLRSETGGRIVYSDKMKVRHRVTSGRLSSRYVAQRAFWIGRTRRVLQKLQGHDLYSPSLEFSLLQRSVRALLVEIIPNAIGNRKMGKIALRIAFVSLVFALTGYVFETLGISFRGRKTSK